MVNVLNGKTRVGIVGTAPSWKSCPFADPGLFIVSLNDAYTLGFPRVDGWFELHPLDHFHYRPVTQTVIYAEDVPPGYYVRPQGHIEQLKAMSRSIPVYLQSEPTGNGWGPNARRFPLEEFAEYGGYWASGPSYMVAWAIAQGAEEIQVWGIHLSTDQEYREQRANFEWWLGIARGKGIKVVMAPESPVLTHGWNYGYQPRPTPHPAKLTLRKTQHEKAGLMEKLARQGRIGRMGPLRDRLARLDALEQDCYRALQQRQPVVIPIGVSV